MSSAQALVRSYDGIPLADSRDVAVQLDIEHRSFFKMVIEYQEEVENDFGKVRFEFASLASGQKQKYALLNKLQTYTYLNYSQNTDKARYAKRMFVKAFDELEQQIVAMKDASSLQGIDAILVSLLAQDDRLDLFVKGYQEAKRGKQKMLEALLSPQKAPTQPVVEKIPEKPLPTPEHMQSEILRHMDRLASRGQVFVTASLLGDYMKKTPYTVNQIEEQCKVLAQQGVLQVTRTAHTCKYERAVSPKLDA